MKRLIAIMLAMVMLVTALLLASCGETKPDSTTPKATAAPSPSSSTPAPAEPSQGQDSSTPAPSSSTPAPSQPTSSSGGGEEPTVQDYESASGLEKPYGYLDVDFGGRTFTIITSVDSTDENWNTENEIYVESRSGSPVDMAVYDRNAVMKSLYNCEIKAVPSDAGGTLLKDDVTAGTNTYDMMGTLGNIFTANTDGIKKNIYDLDINFDIPGWNKTLYEQTTVRDKNGNLKNYTIDGDFNVSGYRAVWVLYCNLDLMAQEFPNVNIFDIVDNKEWTVDKMMEFASVAKDRNGDSQWTAGEDTFFLMSSKYNAFGFIASMGLRFVDNTDYTLTTSTQQITGNNFTDAIEKAGQLYALNGVYDQSYTTAREHLEAATTLFIGEVLDVLKRMADVEDLNVTVLPEPLYSSDQDTYKFYVQNKGTAYVVSKNACGGNMDQMSDFLNLLVFHSNKIVYPAFLQTYGKLYCQNERASDMLDYIVHGRQYDLAYYVQASTIYSQVGGFISSGKLGNVSRIATSFVQTLQSSIDTLTDNLTKSE